MVGALLTSHALPVSPVFGAISLLRAQKLLRIYLELILLQSQSQVSQLLRRGWEENRRGRPKMQSINYEPPLLFIESHQKP
ncbi:hypothetical protein BHM03_00050748 [Ensete ventricosum]|nr:hypothetical protein BHM03_00050748 [Ensete ventricosum]